MRRIKFLCLSIVLILCGCENQKSQLTPVPTEVSNLTASPLTASPLTASPLMASPEPDPEDHQRNLKGIAQQLEQVSEKGEIVTVAQGKNSLFCVQKKKERTIVHYWDLKTGIREKKELSCSLTGRVDVQQTEGYVVLYTNEKEVIVLDQDFHEVSELTIKDSFVDGWNRNYCVLPGDKKIVYTKEKLKHGEWYQEVNECDYNGRNQRLICRIEDMGKSVGKVNRIAELAVSQHEKTLFFTGMYFKTNDKDETSLPCFGEINRDTGKVVSVQEEKNFGHLMGNKMMFVDGLREKGVSSSGYITCLDENGVKENYIFQKKDESQEVIVSDEGNFYLSFERMDNESRTKISCYSFQQSKFQWKKELPQYVSEIWYFEQAKMLLYSYYDDDRNLFFEQEDMHQ